MFVYVYDVLTFALVIVLAILIRLLLRLLNLKFSMFFVLHSTFNILM